MSADFPCQRCYEISTRFQRYHARSWAWDNVYQDLRKHWLHAHRDVDELSRSNFLHSVTYLERNDGRAEEEAS